MSKMTPIIPPTAPPTIAGVFVELLVALESFADVESPELGPSYEVKGRKRHGNPMMI
jgi:hypothetical protein